DYRRLADNRSRYSGNGALGSARSYLEHRYGLAVHIRGVNRLAVRRHGKALRTVADLGDLHDDVVHGYVHADHLVLFEYRYEKGLAVRARGQVDRVARPAVSARNRYVLLK